MADKAWKAYERRVAAQFNMKRALQKGTRAKEDIAPEEGIDAAPWIIDAKKRKRLEVWGWMRELCEYAAEKGKPPILVFQPWGKPQNYAVVTRDFFTSNFSSHMDCFWTYLFEKSSKMTFEEAWSGLKYLSGKKNRIPLMYMKIKSFEPGVTELADYFCIKLENLISLMKAKNMLKGEEDESETGTG